MRFPILKLVAKAESDMIVVKYRVRQIAELAKISSLERTRLISASAEIVRNAIQYAGEARVEFSIKTVQQKQFVEIVVVDNGRGFDAKKQMAVTEPCGLSAARALLDELKIESDGDGSRCTLLKAVGKGNPWITQELVSSWARELKQNSPFSVVEDLEQQNKQLIDTIVEVEKYRNRLEERTEQLNQANKYKTEFLANMSHEIRTPMNAVIGMSNILDRTEMTDEQRKYLRLIKEAGNSLLQIINDILDFSKIEAGKLSIETVEFELFDTVETCVELLSSATHGKGLSLLCSIDPKIPRRVFGDSTRVRQLLVNLINNAIKFTSPGGEVLVNVRLLEDNGEDIKLRFEVIDTGIGLSPQQTQKLFQPFVQADGSTTRKYGGTGLGLSICKRLVELMQGEIGVDSVLGSGSTFWFELPFLVAGERALLSDNIVLKFERALIVDDHAAMREMGTFLLSSWNIKTDSASSAREALQMVQSNKYDLFILDYLMPEMDGLALAVELKKEANCKNSYIVMLTALQDSGLGEKAIAAGCDAFLTKPIRQELLLNCLNSLAANRDGVKTTVDLAAFRQSGQHKTASVRVTKAVPDGSAAISTKKVLLLEDNPTNQIVASIELKNFDLDVAIASNGEEALKIMRKDKFVVIFMDCQMPVMDGYECTGEIRKLETKTGKRIPIIAMTANAMEGDRERCLEAGMDDYISKPFETEKLRELIEKYIELDLGDSESAAEEEQAAGDENEDNGTVLAYDKFRAKFNEAQSKQLLTVFLSDTEKKLSQLISLIEKNDCDSVAKLAHGIKGSSGMIFAENMAAIAAELEMAGKTNSEDRLSPLGQNLAKNFAKFKEVAKQYL